MSDPMTAPDPKTVREIARDALVIAIRRGTTEAVETALIAHGVGGPVVGEKFDAYTNAVAAEYDRLAAERAQPDEQQPADVVTAEQQPAGAVGPCRETDMHGGARHHCMLSTPGHRAHLCGDCGHMWADSGQGFETVLAERDQLRQLLGIGIDCEQWDAIAEAEGCRYEVEQTNDTLVGYLAYQRESSRALSGFLQREVKELEAERTALAARVVELESERDEDARTVDAVAAAEDDELLDRAISNLIARFADRIEALDATETEES